MKINKQENNLYFDLQKLHSNNVDQYLNVKKKFKIEIPQM